MQAHTDDHKGEIVLRDVQQCRDIQSILRRLLLLVMIGTAQQLIGQPGIEPTMLNLGSNAHDGSVTVACSGKQPYLRLSCQVYRLWISRPSIEEYQKWRLALQEDLASKSEVDLLRMQQEECTKLQSLSSEVEKNIKTYSPGRAASARNGYDQMRAVCGCATKECIMSAMLKQQTHDQYECTIRSTAFPADFVRVADHKWVSNNGPEGICGVVSVFTIEHGSTASELWTYTEHYTVANTSSGLCKGLPSSESATYSWRFGTNVRLKCEEFRFDTIPASQ